MKVLVIHEDGSGFLAESADGGSTTILHDVSLIIERSASIDHTRSQEAGYVHYTPDDVPTLTIKARVDVKSVRKVRS